MPLLDDIADFIIASPTDADFTMTNVFAQDMQDTPDLALAVYEYPGDVQYMMGGGGVRYERPRIQVVIRHPDYVIAREKATVVRGILDTIASTTLSGTFYMRVLALDTPHEIAPDARNRRRIATNFEVTREPS